MFKTYDEANILLEGLKGANIPDGVKCIIAPPYIYLSEFVKSVNNISGIHVSAQNCHQENNGAFTGEISASMLQSIQVPYVIIGHSERRAQHNETNDVLKQKVRLALDHNLKPIFCCGESLDIRQKGEHVAFVTKQITESLAMFSFEELANITLAYEPIWAIGTGETASPAQAQEMHQAIRDHIKSLFSIKIGEDMSILYGGSVNASNAVELFSQNDVDGGLVGGAALNAESFIKIINSF